MSAVNNMAGTVAPVGRVSGRGCRGRVALCHPVVGRQTWVGIVEAEVIVRNRDHAIPQHRDGGQKRLPVERRDVERGLVDSDRRGPGQAAVSRHREHNIVVLEVVEPGVFPHGVKIAVPSVLGEGRVAGSFRYWPVSGSTTWLKLAKKTGVIAGPMTGADQLWPLSVERRAATFWPLKLWAVWPGP